MNVLTIVAHPVPTSFNHAIRREVEAGLAEAGHEVEVADLYAEGFQPAMIEADFAQFTGDPLPIAIQAEQARVEWSDAMIFIFPLWWWSMPAMMKGWIDRVMSYGFAWKDPRDPDSAGMRRRKIIVMITAGDDAAGLAKRGYDTALHTQLNVGTWDYCGFKDVTTRIFYGVTPGASEELRAEYLAEARALAAGI
ncbi:MAG: NAD(P)H-dependent oxidoreductase [Paracoccaceae bacterium]|nr:NAD(P)H-dependent oxidoreductase [Paracoccaceae bacterium]MDG1371009.1 NAD(P)H-dependent oxidoreductase [Paracoccaceae bacterium]